MDDIREHIMKKRNSKGMELEGLKPTWEVSIQNSMLAPEQTLVFRDKWQWKPSKSKWISDQEVRAFDFQW